MVLVSIEQHAQRLQQQVAGRVLTAGDPDYDIVRRGWNRTIDHHPTVILVATNANDIQMGVQFAHDMGLGVAVQLTGHGIQHPADDALLIVTTAMTGVQVDADAHTVRVEAGVLWQQVIDAAAPYGLAPLLGSAPHVGVVGYTLGGGVGWLARRYGLAADSVRWLDIVTADGVLRRASPTENAELFWGVRGGGGNFGVVTALGFSLYPLATIYGGSLTYPATSAAEALRFFRDWVKTVPDALTASIVIMKYPSIPLMPETLRGKKVVILRYAFAGDSAEGQSWLLPWLDWQSPLSNSFREMPFSEIGVISSDPTHPAAVYGSNEMFDQLSDEAIDIIVHHATHDASPLAMAELRHVGGAIGKAVQDLNAIGNRDAEFYFQIGGPIFPPQSKDGHAAYIRQFKGDLRHHFRGSVYQNFMSGGEAEDRAKDAYSPESYQRLKALKRRHDPDNLFRFSYQLR